MSEQAHQGAGGVTVSGDVQEKCRCSIEVVDMMMMAGHDDLSDLFQFKRMMILWSLMAEAILELLHLNSDVLHQGLIHEHSL